MHWGDRGASWYWYSVGQNAAGELRADYNEYRRRA